MRWKVKKKKDWIRKTIYIWYFCLFYVLFFSHSLQIFDYFFLSKLFLYFFVVSSKFSPVMSVLNFLFFLTFNINFFPILGNWKKNVFQFFFFFVFSTGLYNEQSLNTHLLSFCQGHFVLSFSLILMRSQKLFT